MAMEVWGGIECSINRAGDAYFDQLEYAGHYERWEDIEVIAGLGIKKIRYPILWERYQPQYNTQIQWEHLEKRLQFFRDRHIDVIAGLVHHGSGPSYVNIKEESFAEGLQKYAEMVANNFPWISYYTPVNEPLTTARFCGLYGLWYPHQRDDKSFLTILLNECKATILAMNAIRTVNASAKLLLTEDIGKIHSTSLLKYQADFENHRRWLSIDLLCGRVDAYHPLWNYILSSGITEQQLDFFRLNSLPPDILGFNYYITSERFIDEDLSIYPTHTHGGNGKHQYADVEVVRSDKAWLCGPYALLKEAWKRYNISMAVTEVHLHCSREEQLRWFNFIYKSVLRLEKEGVGMMALTSWSLLGSFGWDKLLTVAKGTYEPGAFDIRSGLPRPTAIAKMITHIAKGLKYEHPAACGSGWWERECRIIYGQAGKVKFQQLNCAPILILGKTGTLGNAFAKLCQHRNLFYEILSRSDLDVLDTDRIRVVIQEKKPWAIINTTGFVRVDDAEAESHSCFLTNVQACKSLALLCGEYDVKLLTFSTDLVFDGENSTPYTEDDDVNPLNVYGRSKVAAEKWVLKYSPNALIIRSSFFFGPWDKFNFLHVVARHLDKGEVITVPDDVLVSPTYVPDLVNASLDLLIDDEKGIWHLTNHGEISPADLAFSVAVNTGGNASLIKNASLYHIGYKAIRPKYSVLRSKRGELLPTLQNALERYFNAKG
jgi:dTDP-4-dehydrorhamnose reductase